MHTLKASAVKAYMIRSNRNHLIVKKKEAWSWNVSTDISQTYKFKIINTKGKKSAGPIFPEWDSHSYAKFQ